jgi:dTDP-4-dehydrorhamnose 3,5-epimerase
MDTVDLDEIQVTPLARIAVPGGDVMHAMKTSDPGYSGFGEAYFSWVEQGAVKAWKRHQRMTLNLVVPLGEVRFVFYSSRRGHFFREEVIGPSHYARLTVPPGIWFGFQGLAAPISLVLNLANLPHEPEECLHREITEILFAWNQKLS